MTNGEVLFEHRHGGHRWILEIARFRGREYCNWRCWVLKDGDWVPTRMGMTFPLDRLPDLYQAVGDYMARATASAA